MVGNKQDWSHRILAEEEFHEYCVVTFHIEMVAHGSRPTYTPVKPSFRWLYLLQLCIQLLFLHFEAKCLLTQSQWWDAEEPISQSTYHDPDAWTINHSAAVLFSYVPTVPTKRTEVEWQVKSLHHADTSGSCL
jgi:hypothetical protein